jgi:hypothetical protein
MIHIVRGVPCFDHFQWHQQTIWLMAQIMDEERWGKEASGWWKELNYYAALPPEERFWTEFTKRLR